MATALKLDEPVENVVPVVPSAELVVAEPSRGDVVLFNLEAFDQFEAKLREDLKDFVPDLSTAASRKMIASKAFEVTKVKTTLEKQAKALTEEWRTRTNAVNAGRNVIVGRLEALADEVRAPLTKWEEGEKARVAECRSIIDRDIKAAAVVTLDDTAASVRQRGTDVWHIVLDAEKFGDMLPEAEAAKAQAVETLKAALARLTREEADAAELAKLRAENEARAAKEAAEAEEREKEKREAEEAAAAEAKRIADAAVEAEKIERARAEAIEAERLKLQREHEQALAAEKRKAEEAEAARQAEIDRAAAVEAERLAKIEEDAAAQRERDENIAHRTAVKTAAKTALMTCGADEETARKIVVAILAGEIPAVSLRF